MRYTRLIVGVVLTISLISACATIGSIQPGQGSSFQVHDRTYDQVWKAAINAARRSLTIVESNKQGGVIKAKKGAGVTTWGEVVGIFISPASQVGKTFTVEVVSKKRSQAQITGQNWERTIIEGMKAELK